jgi:hypothetical protein
VVFGEAGEVEVGENVAQEDQPLKAILFEHARGFAGVTRLCTEVQVGEDQRVVHVQIHGSVVAKECYEGMKYATKMVQWSPRGNVRVNKGVRGWGKREMFQQCECGMAFHVD